MLVDRGTGHGSALNVMHMVRSLEDAGAGAVHIEDQVLPRKYGHLNATIRSLRMRTISHAKVAAADRARRHLYLIAVQMPPQAKDWTGQLHGEALSGSGSGLQEYEILDASTVETAAA